MAGDMNIKSINTTNAVEKLDKVNKPVDKSFKFTLLSKIGQGELQEKLNSLIVDITKQGEKLAKHMDVSDMRKYRESIKEFMNEVVTHSHEFERKNFLDRRGRHRVYGVIKLVDENLDELAKELIKDEKNQINVLSKVDEIRGLLLDMVV